MIWSYTGLSTPEMEQRVTTYSQYAISSNVNGIKNIEAQTLAGLSVQKIYFQPDVNLDLAIAQIVSATNAIRALLPPGIQAPLVVQFNASSVPVLQISLSSDTLSEQQLYDYGIYRIRQQLAPIPGITLPTPAGGKYRQIMVDLDPAKLLAKGLTPLDVVNAVNAQNLTLPAGTAKFGHTQYAVRTNATPASIDDLNNIPVKVVNGATIFVKDVGQVHDGWLVQQNVVRKDGRRSVLLSIIKNGNASTLSVVNAVHKALETARAAAPPGMQINELFDQSVFVKQSVAGVLREGAIAAALTALMILLFLGSWRSTLVVMISIPLSILASLVVLYFLGETLNTMTLGGLALAVGILVDDFDRHDREHPSPAHRRGDAAAAGHAARRRGDRDPDAGVDARHQLRLHLGGVPRRTGKIPVHPARTCGRVRDAGVLRFFADADADRDRIAAQGRKPRPGRRAGEGIVLPLPCRLRAQLRGDAPCLLPLACRADRASLRHSGVHAAAAGARRRDVSVRRPRLLSSHRRRPDPASRPRAGGNADRGHGEDFPAGRKQDPRNHSRERARPDRRQYRIAGARLQSGIHGRLDHRRQ